VVPIRFGDGFRSAHWFGEEFQLTKMQADVCRVLWEAREKGTPDVCQETPLRACSRRRRLVDVLRGSLAWQRLVVSGNRGASRLNGDPPDWVFAPDADGAKEGECPGDGVAMRRAAPASTCRPGAASIQGVA
jgi:hypothetical protein